MTLVALAGSKQFQSTLPIRGATVSPCALVEVIAISIHAPHTGSDLHKAGVVDAVALISIHAPHTGSDVNRTRKLLHAD